MRIDMKNVKKETAKDFASLAVEVNKSNDAARKAAHREFDKGPVPKQATEILCLVDLVRKRLMDVLEGRAPDEEIGPFTRDSLARTLNLKTYVTFEGRCFMRQGSAAGGKGDETPQVIECTYHDTTDVYRLWRELVFALANYLKSAAVLAKHVCPTSPAGRLFLKAWRIVARLQSSEDSTLVHATPDEALSVVNLERVASERLWTDIAFAELPPFRKPQRPAKPQAKKVQ
jgi:hypothetical protein